LEFRPHCCPLDGGRSHCRQRFGSFIHYLRSGHHTEFEH